MENEVKTLWGRILFRFDVQLCTATCRYAIEESRRRRDRRLNSWSDDFVRIHVGLRAATRLLDTRWELVVELPGNHVVGGLNNKPYRLSHCVGCHVPALTWASALPDSCVVIGISVHN